MNLINKIKTFMGGVSVRTKKGLLTGLGVLVVFAVATAFFLNNKKLDTPYSVLFSGLTEQEATEVMAKLQTSGVDYHYQPDGSVTVPTEVVDKTRATLAVEGFPKNGFTYGTYLDNTNLMSTEADKKSLQVYEMQDRLQATIRLLDGVKDAVVQISPGETRKYVLDNTEPTKPTASVMVVMHDGSTPSAQQVAGIQRMVAKSVTNMAMGDVAIIDGNGIDVSVKKNDTDTFASDEKMLFEEKTQLLVENNILHVLEDMYGRNNVRVSVRCTADVSKMVSEESAVTAPNTENNSGYITQQSLYGDGTGAEAAGGVPGAETNANVPQYNTRAGQTGADGSYSSDTSFALNERRVQSQNDGATISDLTVAVSINAPDLGINRADLTRLIGNAAGIASAVQEEKIVIVNSQWPKTTLTAEGDTAPDITAGSEDVTGTKTLSYLPIIIGTIVGVLLLFLIIFSIIMRKARKKRERAQEAAMLEANAAMPDDLALELAKAHVPPLTVEDERNKEIKDNIRGFAKDNPEISAQLLKSWLRGGEGDA